MLKFGLEKKTNFIYKKIFNLTLYFIYLITSDLSYTN